MVYLVYNEIFEHKHGWFLLKQAADFKDKKHLSIFKHSHASDNNFGL